MCGIAGRFHPELLPPAPEWSARADALLAHRGPDGRGAYRDAHCELVHRRLALIDLSPTGHQPMPNEDSSIYVVFNGEIYNHRALRTELEAHGHIFRGTSDTEVLVHLYEDLGEQMVERLRGIFALAVYDRTRRRLLLARDRFGVKPLFHAVHGGQWVFASEIKAIAALPGFRPELDRQACYDFLGLGYVPEPATGFANVAALAPGTIMVIDARGARLSAFHSVQARPDLRWTLDTCADEVSTALLDAVGSQSVADVPVAAMLSGGIDSSLVVAARHHATGDGTTTFNVRFPDSSHDETPRAHAVAAHYGTHHITVDLPEGALRADAILDLLRHFDQPFADTSLIPTYWIARSVREQGIICTLSGDGGDESFGGYPAFWRANALMRLTHLPAWTTRAAVAVGDRLTPWTQNWGRQVSKAAALAEASRTDASVLLAGLANYLSESQKHELVSAEAREGLEPVYRLYEDQHPTGVADLEHVSQRLTESQFAVSLPSQMLRKVDMMSMRAGIEVRVPLLDEHVVDVGLSLPHALKTDGRKGKLVLRALADRWLPTHVARSGKKGFSIPLDVMAPPELHTALADLLLGRDARTMACTDPVVVRGWLDRFRRAAAGGGDHTGTISREGLYRRLVSVLALELWLRDYRLAW